MNKDILIEKLLTASLECEAVNIKHFSNAQSQINIISYL